MHNFKLYLLRFPDDFQFIKCREVLTHALCQTSIGHYKETFKSSKTIHQGFAVTELGASCCLANSRCSLCFVHHVESNIYLVESCTVSSVQLFTKAAGLYGSTRVLRRMILSMAHSCWSLTCLG